MTRKSIFVFISILTISSVLIVSGCLPQTGLSGSVTPQPFLTAPIVPTPKITPSVMPVLPTAVPTPIPTPALPNPLLAYLRDGDIWLYDFSLVAESRLTELGNIQVFAWSPHGRFLAAYDGTKLCLFGVDTPGTAVNCQPLAPPERENYSYAAMELHWSPDSQYLLLTVDEWWLVHLPDPMTVTHIVDPQDWGVGWPDLQAPDEPAFTGKGLFMADSSLIGTLTHVYMCGSGGCQYDLHSFDLENQQFQPYGNEQASIGRGDLALSPDGRFLANYGTGHAGCAFYTTHVNITDLTSGNGRYFSYDQETFRELQFSPDAENVLVTRIEGCGSATDDVWSIACGLFGTFTVHSMQVWDWQNDQRLDLVPGLQPAWSPDGAQLVFRSCLGQKPDGGWSPIAEGPPWLYAMAMTDGSYTIQPLVIGSAPAWQPIQP